MLALATLIAQTPDADPSRSAVPSAVSLLILTLWGVGGWAAAKALRRRTRGRPPGEEPDGRPERRG